MAAIWTFSWTASPARTSFAVSASSNGVQETAADHVDAVVGDPEGPAEIGGVAPVENDKCLVPRATGANLVREGKTVQIPSIMQTGKKLGMILLNDALAALVASDLVEPDVHLSRVIFEDPESRKSAGRLFEFINTICLLEADQDGQSSEG